MKKIFITGGASGLGKNIVENIFEKNEIHFTYNNTDPSFIDTINSRRDIFSYKCDFTKTEDRSLLLDKIKDINFDVLINNFYIGKFIDRHYAKTLPKEFLDSFNNNIIPMIEISQQIIETFKKKKHGLIISISSSAIQHPPIGTSLYVITKSVIEKLSDVWNNELNKYGISSIVISPNFMKSKLTADIDERIIDLFFKKNTVENEASRVAHEIKKLINDF